MSFRCNVVVPAAPIVPGDEDGGICPVWTVADRVDDGGYPGWSPGCTGISWMVGVKPCGDHPAHLREVMATDIGQNLGFVEDDIVHPNRCHACRGVGRGGVRSTHMLNRVGCRPDRARSRGVVVPSDALRVEFISQRRMFETGVHRVGLASDGINQPDIRGRGGDATRFSPPTAAYGIFGCERSATGAGR